MTKIPPETFHQRKDKIGSLNLKTQGCRGVFWPKNNSNLCNTLTQLEQKFPDAPGHNDVKEIDPTPADAKQSSIWNLVLARFHFVDHALSWFPLLIEHSNFGPTVSRISQNVFRHSVRRKEHFSLSCTSQMEFSLTLI